MTGSSKNWSRKKRPASDRFWEKVNKQGPVPEYDPDLGPCWLWTASRDLSGYGQFGVSGGSVVKAYRWAWQEANGPVPGGLHLDHLCRVRECVRPEHLEPVTQRENLLRGNTVAAASAAATACPQGHPYDETNTYRTKHGHRKCRACAKERNSRLYARDYDSYKDAQNARRRELYALRRAGISG